MPKKASGAARSSAVINSSKNSSSRKESWRGSEKPRKPLRRASLEKPIPFSPWQNPAASLLSRRAGTISPNQEKQEGVREAKKPFESSSAGQGDTGVPPVPSPWSRQHQNTMAAHLPDPESLKTVSMEARSSNDIKKSGRGRCADMHRHHAEFQIFNDSKDRKQALTET